MRPTAPCQCSQCDCRLHVYSKGVYMPAKICIWCKAGEHDEHQVGWGKQRHTWRDCRKCVVWIDSQDLVRIVTCEDHGLNRQRKFVSETKVPPLRAAPQPDKEVERLG